MEQFDYKTSVSDTYMAANRAKAIATAFSDTYMDDADIQKITAQIEGNPDQYRFLFSSLFHALCDVCDGLKRLDLEGDGHF